MCETVYWGVANILKVWEAWSNIRSYSPSFLKFTKAKH